MTCGSPGKCWSVGKNCISYHLNNFTLFTFCNKLLIERLTCIVVGCCNYYRIGSCLCKFYRNLKSFVKSKVFADGNNCVICVSTGINTAALYHKEKAVFITWKCRNCRTCHFCKCGFAFCKVDIVGRSRFKDVTPDFFTGFYREKLVSVIYNLITSVGCILNGCVFGNCTVACTEDNVYLLIFHLFIDVLIVVSSHNVRRIACGSCRHPFLSDNKTCAHALRLCTFKDCCKRTSSVVNTEISTCSFSTCSKSSCSSRRVGDLAYNRMSRTKTRKIVIHKHRSLSYGSSVYIYAFGKAARFLYVISHIKAVHARTVGDKENNVLYPWSKYRKTKGAKEKCKYKCGNNYLFHFYILLSLVFFDNVDYSLYIRLLCRSMSSEAVCLYG